MKDERFTLSNSGVEVRVRRSRRARRMALRIDPRDSGAELVLPRTASLAEGRRFAETKARWLERSLAAVPPRQPFTAGASIPFLGVPHRLRLAPGKGGEVRREGGEIVISCAPGDLATRLEAWLKGEARREIEARARTAAERLGLKPPRRLGLRDPMTRWGSCSGRGALSFSWRLVMAPEDVLDYVIVHEVAHLAEMNHGTRFWTLVERLCPDARRARAWLRRHGDTLRRYG